MSEGRNDLNRLIGEFESAGVLLERMDKSDLNKINRICDNEESIIWLVDQTRLKSQHLNTFGREYFGLDLERMNSFSFGALMDITHKDDLQHYKEAINHFSISPREPHTTCVRLQNFTGETQWVYFVQKALSYDMSGSPEYVLVMIYDIEELMSVGSAANLDKLHLEKVNRYESLTQREKQVLDLVADELTSQEIANQLYIETSTVDTHRKHIIRKLKVKSSLGLVEYSLFYSNSQANIRKAQ